MPTSPMDASQQVDISPGMCLRWTVETRNWPDFQDVESSAFLLKGVGWKLRYEKCGPDYYISLHKCSGEAPNPLHVYVLVESSENGGIVSVLSQVRRFTDVFKEGAWFRWHCIWRKEEEQILRDFTEFRRHGVLKLIVVLKPELEDSNSKASQTECNAPETGEQSKADQQGSESWLG